MSAHARRVNRRTLAAVGIWALWAVVAAAIATAWATGDKRALVLAALAVVLIPVAGRGLEDADTRERAPRPRPAPRARHPKPPTASIHALGRTVEYAGPRPTVDRTGRMMWFQDAPAPGRVHYNHVHVGRRRPHWGWGIVAAVVIAAAITTRRCQR